MVLNRLTDHLQNTSTGSLYVSWLTIRLGPGVLAGVRPNWGVRPGGTRPGVFVRLGFIYDYLWLSEIVELYSQISHYTKNFLEAT